MTRPVQVIVVAYGAAEQLDRCLAPLEGSLKVSVVDNSSSPAVREVVLRRGTRYVDAGANLGFAGGVNLALAGRSDLEPHDVLLLNPDAVIATREIQRLADFLHTSGNERVAALSPRLVDRDGVSERVEWPFPSPVRAWAEAAGFGRFRGSRSFVIGAVLMLRWEALQEVGLFDERFFLYAEETDWQRRASNAGWISLVCDEVVAVHVGAGTSDDPRWREALFHAGQETYIRKWYGRRGWRTYRSAAFLGASVRAVVLGGERRTAAARRALLYVRGPRRCAAIARGNAQ